MKNRFKIGEISKLFGINIKTLRYYDEAGIFKPDYVDPENCYRYYSTDQFELLTMITYMRHLEMPIKEIKGTLDNMNVDNMVEFLENHQTKLEEKIEKLQHLKKKAGFMISNLKDGRKRIGMEECDLEELPQRSVVKLPGAFSRREELEVGIREIEMKLKGVDLIILGKVGVVLSREKLLERDFSEYDALYFLLDGPEKAEEIEACESIEKGLYATLYYSGTIEDSNRYYPKILTYIERKGYRVAGPALERAIISNSATSIREEYVRKIEISVEKN